MSIEVEQLETRHLTERQQKYDELQAIKKQQAIEKVLFDEEHRAKASGFTPVSDAFAATTSKESDTQLLTNTRGKSTPLNLDLGRTAFQPDPNKKTDYKISANKVTGVDGKSVIVISYHAKSGSNGSDVAQRQKEREILKALQIELFAKHKDVEDIFIMADMNERAYKAKGATPVVQNGELQLVDELSPIVEEIADGHAADVALPYGVCVKKRGCTDENGESLEPNLYINAQADKHAEPVCDANLWIIRLTRSAAPAPTDADGYLTKLTNNLPPETAVYNFAEDDLGGRDHLPAVMHVANAAGNNVLTLRMSGNISTNFPKGLRALDEMYTPAAIGADGNLTADVISAQISSTLRLYKILAVGYGIETETDFDALDLTDAKVNKALVKKINEKVHSAGAGANGTPEDKEKLKPFMQAWIDSPEFKDAEAFMKQRTTVDATTNAQVNVNLTADYLVEQAFKRGSNKDKLGDVSIMTSIGETLQGQPQAGYQKINGKSHSNASLEEEQIQSDTVSINHLLNNNDVAFIQVSTESAKSKGAADNGAGFAKRMQDEVNKMVLGNMRAKLEHFMDDSNPDNVASEQEKAEAVIRMKFLTTYKTEFDRLLNKKSLSKETVGDMLRLTRHVMKYNTSITKKEAILADASHPGHSDPDAFIKQEIAEREASRDAIISLTSKLNTRSTLAVLGGIALALVGAALVACAVTALVITFGAAAPLAAALATYGLVVPVVAIEATLGAAAGVATLAVASTAVSFWTKPATSSLACISTDMVNAKETRIEEETALAAAAI